MIRFCFKKGLRFISGQERWELRRRLPTHKLQFESDSGEIANLSDSEVLANWSTGRWSIDESVLTSLNDVMYLATPRDLASFPERYREIARRRQTYLTALDPERNSYQRERWQKVIAATAASIDDPKPPSPSAVHVWWQRYRSKKSIISLIPHAKGGKQRNDDQRFVLFEEVINEIYLNNQKLPKSDVYAAIVAKASRLNAGNDSSRQQIVAPSRTTVYRWLDDLRQEVVDAARLGAEAARVKYRAVLGKVNPQHILERIEIDHTPLDIIVVDLESSLPLGRPWMSSAVDRYSRMIMGFYISFNPPSGHSVLQCLRRSILPKNEWLANFPDIRNEWPAHGIPELIAVDNGMDLHSDGLKETCQELGIEILYCPAAHPEFKGAVERSFRTLAKGLIHKLPGTVFSSVIERGDYPSEELAAIDLKTLIHVITKWVVDIYNVSYHRSIKMSPLMRWQESAETARIELPAYPQQLAVITGQPASRTLFHYGLELEGLHYNSRQLQEIRARCGESIKVQLKFYDDDVGYVHVFDPYAKEYLQVPAINAEYAEKLPRMMHRTVREQARRKFGAQYSLIQLQQAKEEIQQIIKGRLEHKKMAARKKGATLLFADSESVLNDIDPLKTVRRKESPSLDMPAKLPDGLDDDLPDFHPIDHSKCKGDQI